MHRKWILGFGVAMLALTTLLAWAWIDAGIEPVRSLSAPATLPETGR